MKKYINTFVGVFMSIAMESLIVTIFIKLFFMFLITEIMKIDISFTELFGIVFILKLAVTNFIGATTLLINSNKEI